MNAHRMVIVAAALTVAVAAALATALLHVTDGDVLQMKDRISWHRFPHALKPRFHGVLAP